MKLPYLTRILPAACAVCVFSAVGIARAQSIEHLQDTPNSYYSIQLASCQTQVEAEAHLGVLDQNGLNQLWITQRGDRHAVLFGSFDSGAEAQIWRREFRRSDATADAFVVALAAAEEIAETKTLPPVFSTVGVQVASMPLASMQGITAYDELKALDAPETEGEYQSALEAALPLHDQTDPMHGYILANLGILDLKSGREHYTVALEKLLPVARGEVASSASVRVMAMVRSAWLLHQTGDREKALCAWREIQSFSNSEAVKARSRAEEIGLLMELAESGKGTHDEVRRAAANAYAATPANQLKWRAVMELIFSETFARQPDKAPAISARLSEEFIAKYTPLNHNGALDRELGTAMYQAGLFHEWAGRADEALAWYHRVLSEVSPTTDSFAGYHPHAEALGGAARIASGMDDAVMRDEFLTEVLQLYPESQLAGKVRQSRPDLLTEQETQGAGEVE